MTVELSEKEIATIKACIGVTMRSAPDAIAAARDLLPIVDKLDAASKPQESQQ